MFPKFAFSLPIVNVTFLFTQSSELYTVSSPVIFAVTFSTGAVVSIFANVIVSSTTTPALFVNVNVYVPFEVTLYPLAYVVVMSIRASSSFCTVMLFIPDTPTVGVTVTTWLCAIVVVSDSADIIGAVVSFITCTCLLASFPALSDEVIVTT